MKRIMKLIIVGVFLSIVAATTVQAQAVFLARKALGAVQHVTSSIVDSTGKTQKQEVASVLLEADANKVYATALKVIKENKKLRILASNDGSRTIDFTDGDQEVVMKVSLLQDNIAQILVSTGSTTGKSADSTLVVNGILRVCKEMNARCSVAGE